MGSEAWLRRPDHPKDTESNYPGRRCVTGKHGWPSKKLAKTDLRRFNELQKRRLYRCRECGQWHATSMSYMEQVAAGLVASDR